MNIIETAGSHRWHSCQRCETLVIDVSTQLCSDDPRLRSCECGHCAGWLVTMKKDHDNPTFMIIPGVTALMGAASGCSIFEMFWGSWEETDEIMKHFRQGRPIVVTDLTIC